MKTKGKIIIALFMALTILGTAFKLVNVRENKKEETNLVIKTKSDVPVTVVEAKLSNTSYSISYPGIFEPNYEVTVVSEAQGKVKEYLAEEGEYVSEGKILATLENDITAYQMEAAEASFQKAKSDLNRFENLSPGESVSAQQLEGIRLAFKDAQTSWLILKKQYENTFIKAPVSGTISKRYIERGAFIAPGTPVIDLIDTRKMKFITWFDASNMLRVKTGQPVKITTGLYPGLSYDGIIKVIGIKPDESKRYRIQAEVKNNSARPVIPGTDGTIMISLTRDQKNITIPRNCIVGTVIEPKVYVIEGNMAKLKSVIIAEINDGQVIISDGLKENDEVVLSGQINLQDDTKVTIKNVKTL
jgi:RND family efflux transporter MFP subunit